MPTLHQIRTLPPHRYATAGYEVAAVQGLMVDTDLDTTGADPKSHAREVSRVELRLPYPGSGILMTASEPNSSSIASGSWPRLRKCSLRIP